jgi:hypothetical protein
LAFGLLVDYDDLPGDNKSEKAQSLIERCERYGIMEMLIKNMRQQRPNANV